MFRPGQPVGYTPETLVSTVISQDNQFINEHHLTHKLKTHVNGNFTKKFVLVSHYFLFLLVIC